MNLVRILFCLVWVVASPSAIAQILDAIEINRRGKDVEIRIRFTTEIQYLRHTPLGEGKLLRISLRLTNPGFVERDLPQETLDSPETDLVPKFRVTYPELINGMLVTFSQTTKFDVRPGEDARSIIVTVPALAGARDISAEERAWHAATETARTDVVPAVPATAAAPTAKETALAPQPAPAAQPAPAVPAPADNDAAAAPVLSSDEVERLAKKFYAEAATAVEQKDYAKAINRLNRVLGLPANLQTEAAQALIGQTREMNGEYAKARAEYELFLRAFPNSAEVPKIKARLAALPKEAMVASRTRAIPKEAGPAEWTTYGSLSQYWYKGKSHIETTTPPPPGQLTFNTDTLSLDDQDSLITSLDANARRRDAISDSRMVFRYIDNHNALTNGKSYGRVTQAYAEQNDRQAGYFVRLGRQNPNGVGVQERFDGASVGYNLPSDWRVNAVAGSTAEFGLPYDKRFYGTGIEKIALPEHLGYSLYFLDQTLDGAINRRAVGSELRYFDNAYTLYGLFDYDIEFRGLNIALLQANYHAEDTTNYFAVLDHRKTPSLSLLNSLPAFGTSNLQDILDTTPIDQVRDAGKALTAESNLYSIGFTKSATERWQFGADYRLASITSISGFGLMPAQPGTGNNHVLSGQAIGNSIFRGNDVAVANLSLIHSPTYDGQAYSFNYVVQLLDPLRFDGGLRFYTQKDSANEKQTRLNPSARLTYRLRDNFLLEGEAGNEYARIEGPARKDKSDRRYMYFGYRMDMR